MATGKQITFDHRSVFPELMSIGSLSAASAGECMNYTHPTHTHPVGVPGTVSNLLTAPRAHHFSFDPIFLMKTTEAQKSEETSYAMHPVRGGAGNTTPDRPQSTPLGHMDSVAPNFKIWLKNYSQYSKLLK